VGNAVPPQAAAAGFIPSDLGLQAWNYDPNLATSGTSLVSGTPLLIRVNVRSSILATGVATLIFTAGTGLTAAQCVAGLLSPAGQPLGITADQSGVWNAQGLYLMPFAGGPVPIPAGIYYVPVLANFTGGIQLGRLTASATAPIANAGTTPATARYATNFTNQTTILATTLATNGLVNQPAWAGIY
jgi:hypothetical protein